MSTSFWIYLAVSVAGGILLYCYYRSGRFLKSVFFTAFSGIGALGILWILGRFLSISLTITPLTLLVSGVLGIPGVIGMLVLLTI